MAYPDIDNALLDWFAGAINEWEDGKPSEDWDDGIDVSLSFDDVGGRDTDHGYSPRGQLVMHAAKGGGLGTSISLEIDRNDAKRLIKRMQAWLDETEANAEEEADWECQFPFTGGEA